MSAFINTIFLCAIICYKTVEGKVFPSCAEIKSAFQGDAIVPDVIPKAPSKFVKLGYEGVTGPVTPLGAKLTFPEIATEPTIRWPLPKYQSKLYTVIMLDPDSPCRSNPFQRSTIHWMITNAPSGSKIKDGDLKSSYLAPGPGGNYPVTETHRFAFLVYEQRNKDQIDVPDYEPIFPNRIKFNLTAFISKYNLKETPIAGTYIDAGNHTAPRPYTCPF